MAAVVYDIQFFRNGKRIRLEEMNSMDASAMRGMIELYQQRFTNKIIRELRKEAERPPNSGDKVGKL